MGTVVHAGNGTGVVVATGGRAEFGRIALGLGERQPQTEFQLGLRRFSCLLLQVAVGLTSLIFVTNVVLHRPLIESLLFSLAIAVGITPQLLPAVVSTSLATGSRQLARRKVLVKRLVCIEDLGDMDVLFTDKTGTLTEGRISFTAALPAAPAAPPGSCSRWGCWPPKSTTRNPQASPVGGNPLDAALWASRRRRRDPARPRTSGWTSSPSTTRRRTSVLVSDHGGRGPDRHQGRAGSRPGAAARTSRPACRRCLTNSSTPAPGWSPSRPGPPLAWPRLVPRTNKT